MAQVEGAQRCFEIDDICDLAALADIVGHHALGQQANQELQFAVAAQVGERVRTAMFGAWHFQTRILARQVVQGLVRCIDVQVQDRGAWRNLLHLADPALQ
ncbi:hypothetical protein D3C78_1761930 [compost metagenome]